MAAKKPIRARFSVEVKAAVEGILDSGKGPQAKIDSIYELLVRTEGLYQKAYFGHRKTPKEAKRLAFFHKYAVSCVVAREAKYADPEVVMAPGGAEPAGFDDVQPRCDICGLAQALEGTDWNGSTGNHFSCEGKSPTEAEAAFVAALGLE